MIGGREEEREANESAALSGGRDDEEEREANESAALSGGRDEERGAREAAASGEGFEDGRCHEDEEERDASESATLNEGRGTRLDFLETAEKADAGESAGLCGARVDFPCAESLLGLMIVMGEWGLLRDGGNAGHLSNATWPYRYPLVLGRRSHGG